jgi:hypothetical protein
VNIKWPTGLLAYHENIFINNNFFVLYDFVKQVQHILCNSTQCTTATRQAGPLLAGQVPELGSRWFIYLLESTYRANRLVREGVGLMH